MMLGVAKQFGGAVVALMVILVLVTVPAVSPVVKLSADRTALILGGTTGPTPDDTYLNLVKQQYVAPTHPGEDIDYVAVTTPEEPRTAAVIRWSSATPRRGHRERGEAQAGRAVPDGNRGTRYRLRAGR